MQGVKKLLIALGAATSLTACTNAAPVTPTPTFDFAGQWTGVALKMTEPDKAEANLTVTNGKVSGTFRIITNNSGEGGFDVEGTVNGDQIDFTAAYDVNSYPYPWYQEGCKMHFTGYAETRDQSVHLTNRSSEGCGRFYDERPYKSVILYRK